jgi:sorting nexin-1/2
MEFSEAIGALAASNLSRHLSNSLSVLAEAEKKAKEFQEIEAKDDTVTILGTGTQLTALSLSISIEYFRLVEEYIRLISSVRVSFLSIYLSD